MASRPCEKKIKSADRVLDIFEMFNEGCSGVSVMDVVRALDLPQSSTSELLSSLVRRGYLTRKRGERKFRPTSRVALLGAWVHPQLYRNGGLLLLMDQLRNETGLTVALSSLFGVSLKHIHAVGDLPDPLRCGADHHPLHSPFGHVILSTLYRENVRLLVHRLNAESGAEDQISFCDLDRRVERVSRQRFALGAVAPGHSGMAVLLPQSIGEEQLSIGLIGPSESIEGKSEELLRGLRQAISTHLGPRVVSRTTHELPKDNCSAAFS